jgi:AcrR family transcriptional regulator
MGHSKAEKAKTHKRIVSVASKRFREEGLAGASIADLMKEAASNGRRLQPADRRYPTQN